MPAPPRQGSGAPPAPRPPRYCRRPLPGSRYLPGSGAPRPTAPLVGPDEPPLDPRRWERCEAYRYGVDLFNAGCWWEAHEVWEELWRPLPPAAPERSLLQGLIQLAAARLKRHQGRLRAARRLAAKAATRLRAAGPGPRLGLDPEALAERAAAYAEARSSHLPDLRLASPESGARGYRPGSPSPAPGGT